MTSIPDFLGSDPFATATALETLAQDLRTLALGGSPPAEVLGDAPFLHRWGFMRKPCLALAGTVYGHPLLGDGSSAVTSEIFVLDPDRRWARTFSRFYALGSADPFNGAS